MKGRAVETAFAVHAAGLESTTRDIVEALANSFS